METIIVLIVIATYLAIGSFFSGAVGRFNDWDWDYHGDFVPLISTVLFWPLVFPLLVVMGANWLGKRFVDWCKGEKE